MYQQKIPFGSKQKILPIQYIIKKPNTQWSKKPITAIIYAFIFWFITFAIGRHAMLNTPQSNVYSRQI